MCSSNLLTRHSKYTARPTWLFRTDRLPIIPLMYIIAYIY
nr:MAG TPA: hypothetical protein [Caudoviricetes sp.]DAX54194.1 MAG TPA: hypothetical protein [Caudoviricetes sp.]